MISRRMIVMWLVMVPLLAGATIASAKITKPRKFLRCQMCHGLPGAGGKKDAPDLARTRLSYRQFVRQIRNGSSRFGRPAPAWRFLNIKMPAQTGISDEQMEEIYRFIKQNP